MDGNLKRLGALVGLAVRIGIWPRRQPVQSTAIATSFQLPQRVFGLAGPTRSPCVASTWSTTRPRLAGFATEDEAVCSAYKTTGWSAGIAI